MCDAARPLQSVPDASRYTHLMHRQTRMVVLKGDLPRRNSGAVLRLCNWTDLISVPALPLTRVASNKLLGLPEAQFPQLKIKSSDCTCVTGLSLGFNEVICAKRLPVSNTPEIKVSFLTLRLLMISLTVPPSCLEWMSWAVGLSKSSFIWSLMWKSFSQAQEL